MDIRQLEKTVKNYIKQGELDPVFDLLDQEMEETPQHEALILQQAIYNDTQRQLMNNIIDYAEAGRIKSIIRQAILSILKQFIALHRPAKEAKSNAVKIGKSGGVHLYLELPGAQPNDESRILVDIQQITDDRTIIVIDRKAGSLKLLLAMSQASLKKLYTLYQQDALSKALKAKVTTVKIVPLEVKTIDQAQTPKADKVSRTNEAAFEEAIENTLVKSLGYEVGKNQDFNVKYALDEPRFWQFLENTQATELDKLKRQSDWKQKVLSRLDRMITKYGVLHVLKRPLEVDDASFTLFYQAPLASSGQTVHERFASNQFSVMRQLHYSASEPHHSIDMGLFVNGLPLATIELKNPWTGQTAAVQGRAQYKKRDIRQPLLQFGRCLVHFALDPDEVYMTTRLNGEQTFFLPFNKGKEDGSKGNPKNEHGYRTAYLWQEVFTRESWANIIQHFMRFDGKANDPLHKRTLFFPRYHQLDVVRRLVRHASEHGTGQSYLIQHSAGSGKSNSITWAAYQLIETYPATAQVQGARDTQTPLFDSVIVVTDRRLLDTQIANNIRQFSEVSSIMARAHSSRELKECLEQGKKIIITTIQKFPFIVDGISDLSQRRFAVIIDEAHSSQGGVAAGTMNVAMGQDDPDDTSSIQDRIVQAIKNRKMKGNASYFAFTATPKNITLEKFGNRQPDGSFAPFHLYSMKQAIEEGFILDVLANYTTYKSYYEIEKSVQDNPEFDKNKAQKRLRAYVEGHAKTIDTKAKVIYEHFVNHIVKGKRLKGKGKAMVVTRDIETAIRYYFALNKIAAKGKILFKIAVAFSGEKEVDGNAYTEAGLNGFADKDTPKMFDQDEYRILVVANKYLTGFDQPKLCAMYVDKKLSGVIAVQALSRLNRAANRWGKKTEDLFVLDFFNTIEDIKTAFDPFYTSTSLNRATDVGVLDELRYQLGDMGVYEWSEVEAFSELYFSGVPSEELDVLLQQPEQRFYFDNNLSDEDKAHFKIQAKQFVKIYGQMASIISFEKLVWEQLFWFLKFLIPKLRIKHPQSDALDALLDSVDLSTYGLERTRLNETIELDEEATGIDPQNPNPRGVHQSEEETQLLDEIVRIFNEHFEGWHAASDEKKRKLVSLTDKMKAHSDFMSKFKENPDEQTRKLTFDKIMQEVILKQRSEDLELYKLFFSNDNFKHTLADALLKLLK